MVPEFPATSPFPESNRNLTVPFALYPLASTALPAGTNTTSYRWAPPRTPGSEISPPCSNNPGARPRHQHLVRNRKGKRHPSRPQLPQPHPRRHRNRIRRLDPARAATPGAAFGEAAGAYLVGSASNATAVWAAQQGMNLGHVRIVRNVTEYLSAGTAGMLCCQSSRAGPVNK